MKCPLCRATAHREIASATASEIVGLYDAHLGVDIRSELAGVSDLRLLRCARCDLQWFDPAAAGSESFYELLQPFAWYYLSTKPEYAVALRWMPEKSTVLEVGCGRGAFAALLPPDALYVGLELSDAAVRLGAAESPHIRRELIEDHAAENPSVYDVAVSFQVLEHVANPHQFLDSMVRCVKPGGRLILSVPAADGFMGRISDNYLNLPPHHVTWWSDRALASVAEHTGVEMLDLVHDRLGPEHRSTYLANLLVSAVIRHPPRGRLVESRPAVRWLHGRAQSWAARISRVWTAPALQPRGHSVTAIYAVRES